MTNFEFLIEEIGRTKCVVAFFFFSEGREWEYGLRRHPRSVRLQRIAAGAATNNSNYHRRAVQVQAWLSKSSPAYAVRDEYDNCVSSSVQVKYKLSTSFEHESA